MRTLITATVYMFAAVVMTTTSEPVFNEELEHNADDDGDGSSGAVGSGDLISEGDPNGGNEGRTTKAATTSIADPACVLKTISGAACITQPYAISAEEGSPVFNACGDIDLAPW